MAVLKQAEGDIPASELCRARGMSGARFYKWRARFGGTDAALVPKMKEMAEENRRLKRLKRDKAKPLAMPERPNETWSMNVIADQLAEDRSIRGVNVLDDFTLEGLASEMDVSRPAERGLRSLKRIIEWRGQPHVIRVYNRPEHVRGKRVESAERRNVRLEGIQPGKPQQNACIERDNRSVRGEWLGQYIFETIEKAQDQATEWLWIYNNAHPKISIGGITPALKLKTAD